MNYKNISLFYLIYFHILQQTYIYTKKNDTSRAVFIQGHNSCI